MSNESTISMANEIAELIINKSFWGNEWFVFFSLLLVGLIAAFSAWAGTYLSTRSQNAAIRADFEKALGNLKKQTKSIKSIEERIAHDFIEERERLKVKRSKVEELYMALSQDQETLGHNLTIATTDQSRDILMPSNKAEMLAYLYFKNELEREIEYFREQRGQLVKRIKQLSEVNLDGGATVSKQRIEDNMVYFRNYHNAKTNIEIALESEMQNLTKSSSKDAASGAA
jgi:hypothetical protein